MTGTELIEFWITCLEAERACLTETAQDGPVVVSQGRLMHTTGGLHLYEFIVPADVQLSVDLPVSIVPSDEADTTEGIVLRQTGNSILIQLVDALGREVPSVTLVPDQAGLVSTSASRLKDMLAKPDLYHLGPTERLASLLQMQDVEAEAFPSASSVFTTVWSDDQSVRRQKLGNLAMELIRANKRILLISPDHLACDEMVGMVGRTMKAGGLNHTTWITRYELPIVSQPAASIFRHWGSEAQMHQFYAKSQGNKASLRFKYEASESWPLFCLRKKRSKKIWTKSAYWNGASSHNCETFK